MAVVHIGEPGFDFVKMSGFQLNNTDREHLISNYTNSRVVRYNATITVSTNKLSVADGFFCLDIGKSGLTEYVNLEVHASDEMGNNVANMTVADVREKIVRAINILHTKYGIDLSYYWNNLVITKCEINITFPLEKPFGCYRRILTLLAYVVIARNGKGNKYDVSAKEVKNAFIQEGLFVKRSSYKVRVYNKKKEINDKLEGVLLAEELMRVEVSYIKREEIQNDLGTRYLCKLSDDTVTKAFIAKFCAWEGKIDKYLNDKMLYHPGFNGSKNTISNIIANHIVKGDCVSDCVADLVSYEAYYNVPIVLDINDIEAAANWIYYNRILNFDLSGFYSDFMDAYQGMPEACKLLNGQREMYEEVFSKIKGCPAIVNIYY